MKSNDKRDDNNNEQQKKLTFYFIIKKKEKKCVTAIFFSVETDVRFTKTWKMIRRKSKKIRECEFM